MSLYLAIALLPVILLCFYIYKKDVNKEPKNLLMKILGFGILICVPVAIVELLIERYFPTDNITNYLRLFIDVFIGIAFIEEVFKWLVVKRIAYENKEFDQIYDAIVYSVFSSLGFAALENILYVFTNGISTGILRAILAVPGHACYGVFMGYYFGIAKLVSVNKNMKLARKNLLLSIFIPTTLHTIYDFLLLVTSNTLNYIFMIIFVVFVIILYIFSIKKVNTLAKIQNNFNGIEEKDNPVSSDTSNSSNNQLNNNSVENSEHFQINYCPVCGKKVNNSNFCGYCGNKLK